MPAVSQRDDMRHGLGLNGDCDNPAAAAIVRMQHQNQLPRPQSELQRRALGGEESTSTASTTNPFFTTAPTGTTGGVEGDNDSNDPGGLTKVRGSLLLLQWSR